MKSPALRAAGDIAAARLHSVRNWRPKVESPDITIPDEALEEVADEFADAMQCPKRCERTFHSLKGVPCECSNRARAACLAMLRAWPGMTSIKWDGQIIMHLKCPLPQEPRDE